jgi:hypothetical protein
VGSVPTQHREEFRELLICSGDTGLESEQCLGESTYRLHSIPKLCQRPGREENSRLVCPGPQWSNEP